MSITIRILIDPNLLPGIFFVVISIPLFTGAIPRNRFYGFRIRKAFVSDDNWYAINKYGAKQLIIYGSLMIVAGIVALFSGITPPFPFNLAPLLLGTTVAIVNTLLFARKLPG